MKPNLSELERNQIAYTQAVLKSAVYLLPFFVLGFLMSLGFVWLHPLYSYVLFLYVPVSLAGIYWVWRCLLDVHLWQAVLFSGSLNDLDECLEVFFKRSLKGTLLEKRLAGNRMLFRRLFVCTLVQVCLLVGMAIWMGLAFVW